MTILIQQRKLNDSAIAVTAMYLGVTYEEAETGLLEKLDNTMKEKVKYDEDEIPESIIQTFIRGKIGKRLFQSYSRFNILCPAIVQVRSLNLRGKQHFVYWDGKELYDPNEGVEGRAVYPANLFKYAELYVSVLQEALHLKH